MSYDDYLGSQEWRDIRDEVMCRDSRRCQSCRDDAHVVHHLNYERVGNEDLDDLVSLCWDCHESHHYHHGDGEPFKECVCSKECKANRRHEAQFREDQATGNVFKAIRERMEQLDELPPRTLTSEEFWQAFE